MWAALAILLVAATGLAVTYRFARAAQIEAVQSELLQMARLGAIQIDGDRHLRLSGPDQLDTEDHLVALAPLVALHRATRDVMYVYTVVLRGDQIHFVLDTSWVLRPPGHSLPPDGIMSVYGGSDRELRTALVEQRAMVNRDVVVERENSYMSSYAPFYDSHGRFVGVLGIDMQVSNLEARLARIRDAVLMAFAATAMLAMLFGVLVTGWRRSAAVAAERMRQAYDDLAHARDEAERQAAEAVAANRAKSTFLAVMSHELRTPLNAILGYADLLDEQLADKGDRVLREDVSRIQGSGLHLLTLINDILEFSRIEAGRIEFEPVPVDVEQTLADLETTVEPQARAKGLAFTVTIDPAAPGWILTDPGRLRQVLLILTRNAVKFTSEGAVEIRVHPETSEDHPMLHVEVRDTGIGIAAEILPVLFQPFSQGDGSHTRRFGGTGLGLAISSKLIQFLGGRLWVESEPGRGSTFHFTVRAEPPSVPAALAG